MTDESPDRKRRRLLKNVAVPGAVLTILAMMAVVIAVTHTISPMGLMFAVMGIITVIGMGPLPRGKPLKEEKRDPIPGPRKNPLDVTLKLASSLVGEVMSTPSPVTVSVSASLESEREDEELRRKAERERKLTEPRPRVLLAIQTILGEFPRDRSTTPARLSAFVNTVHQYFYTAKGPQPVRVHEAWPTPSVHLIPSSPEYPQRICATTKVYVLNETIEHVRAVAQEFVKAQEGNVLNSEFTFTVEDDEPPATTLVTPGMPSDWWKRPGFEPRPEPRSKVKVKPIEKVVSPPVKPAAPSKSEQWIAAKDRLNEVSMALMDFEMNPREVYFTRPLLRVLTEPATMRFYDAYGDAQALNSESEPDSADHVSRFSVAVGLAENAWKVADRNARAKAEQNIFTESTQLSDQSVTDLRVAQKLMDRALDEASTPAEASLSWGKSLELLDRAGLAAPDSLVKSMIKHNTLVARVARELES